jgi:Ion channel
MLPDVYTRNRYGVLFFGLLLSLVLSPVLDPLGLETGLVEVLLAMNLVAAALALEHGPVRRMVLVVLAIALVTRPAANWMDQGGVSIASLAVWGVLALGTVAGALRFALRGSAVGREQIYAALSAYLLAGMFFGVLYSVLEQVAPGSLSTGSVAAPGEFPLTTAMYFSFVTLASLGYGDILPLSDPARGLAIVEVVGGQLYLAVMVARLVSAWRA